MKKYPIITITSKQYQYTKNLLKTECMAKVQDNLFKFTFNKKPQDLKNCYCSTEWNTILYVVKAIAGNYNKRLNITEEV